MFRTDLAVPLLLAAALLGSEAWAATGLEWQWEGVEHRFYIQAQVRPSELMWFRAENNREVRVAEFRVNLSTTCRPERLVGKRGWELRCDLDDFGIAAAPVASEQGLLLPILDELDDKFTGAWLQVVFTRDGRVKNVDLEGVDKSNRRISQIHESMRLVLVRAFAGLDLQLPKNGDDKGKGSWKQKAALAMGFPSDLGTMGSAEIIHEITATDGDVVELSSTGRGVLGSGEMVEVAGQERPKNLYDMSLSGTARFDVGRGLLLSREYLVEGNPTASSMMADGWAGIPYVQAVQVSWVEPGVDLPVVGDNQELDAVAHPHAHIRPGQVE